MEDLNLTIIMNEKAIISTSERYPDRVIYLSNLGNELLSRFEYIGSMDDLNRSILMNE